MIALMQLHAGIAGQPSITNGLTRFVPRAGERSVRLAAVATAPPRSSARP